MLTQRLKLVLIDDHHLFADALSVRLGLEPDLDVTGMAHGADGVAGLVARQRPDVVLLDHVLGRHDGLRVLQDVRRDDPAAKVIMLSARSELGDVVNAIRYGARAWVAKSGDIQALTHVIRLVADGGSWLPEHLLGPVLDRLVSQAAAVDALAVLTTRERDVLAAMLDGLSRAEIGRRLHLSPNTVRTHMRNLFAKLDCHSVLEAVALARRNGMLPGDPRPPADARSRR
jgi:DNA-binding NarL/FixJ family response regulator